MGQLFARPGQNPGGGGDNQDQVAFWLRILAKACGTVGGIIAMAMGIFVAVSFSAKCIASGIFMVVFGFFAVTMEAPCCCMFLDFIDKIGKFSDSRPHWQKAFGYVFLALLPLVICPEVSTFLGMGLIFVTGCLYGMFALGKKADRDTMLASASAMETGNSNIGPSTQHFGSNSVADDWDARLVDNNKDPVVFGT